MGKSRKKKVSDIAKAVGVSPGTVSNALNNRKGVSEDKRIEIIEVAREMGYERNFAKITSRVIKLIQIKSQGNIVGDTYFFTQVMQGVQKACDENDYELLMVNLDLKITNEEQVAEYCSKEMSDGVILLATELTYNDLKLFDNLKCPVVLLDNCFRESPFDSVLMNNDDGVYLAIKHLATMGHRRIGLLNSINYINNFYYRRKSFYSSMTDLSLSENKEYEVSIAPSIDGSYEDMMEYLDKTRDLPTAYFAVNDIIAFGAIRALSEKGYRVPEDVSVIGFDDMLLCEISSPRLSTISVDKEAMGWIAVKRLIKRIDNENISTITRTSVKCKLIQRDSVFQLDENNSLNNITINTCL